MKVLKPRLISALRDREVNNIVVGVLVAIDFLYFIAVLSPWYGGISWSFWLQQAWRNLISFLVILIVAELLSRLAKK